MEQPARRRKTRRRPGMHRNKPVPITRLAQRCNIPRSPQRSTTTTYPPRNQWQRTLRRTHRHRNMDPNPQEKSQPKTTSRHHDRQNRLRNTPQSKSRNQQNLHPRRRRKTRPRRNIRGKPIIRSGRSRWLAQKSRNLRLALRRKNQPRKSTLPRSLMHHHHKLHSGQRICQASLLKCSQPRASIGTFFPSNFSKTCFLEVTRPTRNS